MFGKDFFTSGWFFGDTKKSYQRAVINEARAATAAMAGDPAAVRALDGDESFLLGTLSGREDLWIAPREVGRHGMVWGSSGAGKSFGLAIITDGWSQGGTR